MGKKKERIEALEREVQEIKYFINENIDELCGKTPFGKVAPPTKPQETPKYVDKNGDELIKGNQYEFTYKYFNKPKKEVLGIFNNGKPYFYDKEGTSYGLEYCSDITPLPTEQEWKPSKGELVKAWNDDPDDWCIVPFIIGGKYRYPYWLGIFKRGNWYKHISPIDSTTIEQLKERIK